jgi:hypothetical protein
MVKRVHRGEDGLYHINGKTYKDLVGSRKRVWYQSCYKTRGGLTKNELMQNHLHRIVSKVKHETAKRERRLEKHGYFTRKGKFGYVKKSVRKTRRNKSEKKE